MTVQLIMDCNKISQKLNLLIPDLYFPVAPTSGTETELLPITDNSFNGVRSSSYNQMETVSEIKFRHDKCDSRTFQND